MTGTEEERGIGIGRGKGLQTEVAEGTVAEAEAGTDEIGGNAAVAEIGGMSGGTGAAVGRGETGAEAESAGTTGGVTASGAGRGKESVLRARQGTLRDL